MEARLITIAVSGYFDPLHVGHLEYLEQAAALGDKPFFTKLVVIVNTDKQASLKKGKSFMKEEDRLKIVRALRCVDEAFLAVDEDQTVCESLRLCKPDIFANGGDRTEEEIPEAKVCKELKIEMVDGLGQKIRSSSEYTGLKKI
jgi:D-beta-D-heptose 7-phosphate kinase/D-beta-D-heptose 1-phosphate adenosyltransferase